jgi:DNA primase large subunit
MSSTLDDRAAMSYDEMAIACSKDIEDYKTLLKSIEAMIAQKQRNLQNIKDKTVGLVKTAQEIIPTQEIPVNQPAENFDYAGVDMVEDLTPEAEIESEEAVAEDSQATTPPKKERTQKSRPSNRMKAAEKGKVKRADKPREPAERSQKISQISDVCITLKHL